MNIPKGYKDFPPAAGVQHIYQIQPLGEELNCVKRIFVTDCEKFVKKAFIILSFTPIMEDREEILLNALNHKVRREILRLVKTKGCATYTQILDRTELPTGKLNYHLKQLTGLLEKTASDEYQLTPLGEKAVVILNTIQLNGLDEYFKRVKEVQTKSISPLMKGLLRGGIVVTVLILGFWSYMGYLVYTEGAPIPVKIILVILYGLGVALLIFLVNAYRTAPEYIERLERRIFGNK